jgi:hypothetical protein
MTLSDWINPLISILAVVVSCVALIRVRKNTSRLIELEEIHARLSQRQLQKLDEQDKERLKAKLNVCLDSSNEKFIIENVGLAKASDIYFSLGQDNQHNPLVHGDFEHKIPYPALNRNEKYFLRASIPLNVTQIIYHIDLRWFNEDGSQEKKTYAVSR